MSSDPIGSAVRGAEASATIDALGRALVAALAGHVPFDRFNVGLIDAPSGMFIDAFVHGQNVPGRATGHLRPLAGSVVEAADRAGDGTWFGSDDRERWVERFPGFGPVFDSGIQAMLAVPIRADGALAAALVLASRNPTAYGDAELAVMVAVGRRIAPHVLRLRRDAIVTSGENP